MDLTHEQIAQFNEQGWLFLPELFTPEEVAVLRREAEAVYQEHRPEVWREKNGAPRTAFRRPHLQRGVPPAGRPPPHDPPHRADLRRAGL